MSYLRVLLISTVGALLVHKGETLKCWDCDSSEAPVCGYPFLGSADVKKDQIHIKECNPDHYRVFLEKNPLMEFLCRKETEEINGKLVVVRGCALALPNTPRGSCMYPKPRKTTGVLGAELLTCDLCAGDLCNGAASLGAVAVLIVPLLVLLV